ncbi:MAG: hypothetical protein GX303_02930 [Clostridiales bacterium]|nr:hypothetical protein [Clostridiales bacterium]
MESGAIYKYFKNMKGKGLIIFGLVLGLLLVAGGGLLSDRGKQKETGNGQENAKSQIDNIEDYRRSLEERVTVLCAQVKGASNVSVLLTLEAGSEYVYAQNSEISGTDRQKSEYVISSSSGSPNGLLVKENYPKICGIAVVCTGGDNIGVKKEITDLLSAAFNLPSNRIYVAAGK